jgi:hypothetical protein
MKPEAVLSQMAKLYQNFKINPSKLSGILKISEESGLKVDSDQEPGAWTVYSSVQGEYFPIDDCPESTVKACEAFIQDYKQIRNEEPEKDHLDNLEGFEGLPTPEPEKTEDTRAKEYMEQKRQETPKKEVWSKPAPKTQPEKIPYDEGLESGDLPAITGVGIVRPVVNAAQALAAWNEFQALKRAIIEPSDLQEIEVYDKKTGTKKKSKFIKKSGWRKLAACFNLTIRIESEVKEPTKNGGFLWTIRVVCMAPNGREMTGVAKCSSDEKTGSRIEHDVYSTAYTRSVNRAISDLIAAGECSAEELEA